MQQDTCKAQSCIHFSRYLVFTASLLLSTQTMADLEEESLFLQLSGDEELISIATGTPRPVSKAPAVASVITTDDIRASGANTLQEVLERVPGLHVIASQTKFQSPTYSFRGINTAQGPQTLFLVNGQEITYLLVGGLQHGQRIPLASISRIEVIRGPGSAVYGADAFAGVINIITKTSADIDGMTAGVMAGSFDTRNIWGQYGGETNGWQIAATIEYIESNGDGGRKIDRDLQTNLDAIFGSSASLAPESMRTRYDSLVSNITLTKDKWTMHLNSWNGEYGTGAGIANALEPKNDSGNYERYLFDISYEDKDWRPGWALQTTFSHLYTDSDDSVVIFPPGARLAIGADGNFGTSPVAGLVDFPDGYIGRPGRTENTSKFDITTLYSGWPQQVWRLNIGVKKEDIEGREKKNFGPGVIDGTVSPVDGRLTNVNDTAFIYLPDKNRTVTFASVQNEWDFAADWQLIAGLRYDNYSDFGGTANPRASLIWNTRHNLTSKLLYGRAFRAPSFIELFAQNNPIVLGNPNLDPEVIDTYELVFDYKPANNLNLIFNLFHYRIDGLIDFIDDDGIPGGSATAQNSIDQKASGFELEVQWQATGSLRLFGSTAFQNAEDEDTNNKVADAPRKQLHLGGNWRMNQLWSGQLDAFRIMDRPRAAGDARDEVDDYTWVNLAINGTTIYKSLDFQLAVRNLFDTDAREPGPASIPDDYPLEGRSYFVGLSKKF